LRFGAFLGFAWWLLWIPLAVAVGVDAVVYPPALWISASIGIVGLVLSSIAFARFLRSENQSADQWRRTLAGESLRAAYLALQEFVDANID
jgi:serine/threonine-protein kinase